MKSEYYLDWWGQCHKFVYNFDLSQFQWSVVFLNRQTSTNRIFSSKQKTKQKQVDLIYGIFVESMK